MNYKNCIIECRNTVKECSFNILSEKCLLDMLGQISQIKDLLNLRLVNRRLNKTIQRHYKSLVKLQLPILRLIGTISNKFIRYNKRTFMPQNDNLRFYSQLSAEKLCGALRHIESKNLVLEYIEVSEELLFQLQRCTNAERLESVELQRCSFAANTDNNFCAFVSFLREFRVLNISLLDCKFSHKILTSLSSVGFSKTVSLSSTLDQKTNEITYVGDFDYLFRVNSQLNQITLSCRDEMSSVQVIITDKTLNYWTQSGSWPSSFVLQNARSFLTIPAIFRLVYQVMSRDFGNHLFWNFDKIPVSCQCNYDKTSANQNNFICKILSKYEEFQSLRKFIYNFGILLATKDQEVGGFNIVVFFTFASTTALTKLNLRLRLQISVFKKRLSFYKNVKRSKSFMR